MSDHQFIGHQILISLNEQFYVKTRINFSENKKLELLVNCLKRFLGIFFFIFSKPQCIFIIKFLCNFSNLFQSNLVLNKDLTNTQSD